MSNSFQELKESSLPAVLIHQKYTVSFTYCLTAVTPELGERSCSLLKAMMPRDLGYERLTQTVRQGSI